MLGYTVNQSISSKSIDHTFVSTNDEKISDVAKRYGAEVILRPEDLCTDQSSSESAVLHTLDQVKIKYKIDPDIIVLLQATSPLRLKDDIDNSVTKFMNKSADSLFSVTKASDLTIWSNKNGWSSLNFDYKKRLMRQNRPVNYIENGSIYIFTPKLVQKLNNRIGGKITTYEMKFWQTWEIDTMDEVDLVEFYINKKGLNNFG